MEELSINDMWLEMFGKTFQDEMYVLELSKNFHKDFKKFQEKMYGRHKYKFSLWWNSSKKMQEMDTLFWLWYVNVDLGTLDVEVTKLYKKFKEGKNG